MIMERAFLKILQIETLSGNGRREMYLCLNIGFHVVLLSVLRNKKPVFFRRSSVTWLQSILTPCSKNAQNGAYRRKGILGSSEAVKSVEWGGI